MLGPHRRRWRRSTTEDAAVDPRTDPRRSVTARVVASRARTTWHRGAAGPRSTPRVYCFAASRCSCTAHAVPPASAPCCSMSATVIAPQSQSPASTSRLPRARCRSSNATRRSHFHGRTGGRPFSARSAFSWSIGIPNDRSKQSQQRPGWSSSCVSDVVPPQCVQAILHCVTSRAATSSDRGGMRAQKSPTLISWVVRRSAADRAAAIPS